MRRCVTCVKLYVFVLGSMTSLMLIIIGHWLQKNMNRMTYFCALYVLQMVHSLAVLKGHPECFNFKMRENRLVDLTALSQTPQLVGMGL